METGAQPLVHSAAKVFKDICYQYRDQMSAGIILGGWDKEKGGQVFGIPIGGMIVRQPVAIGGSGSSYIYGFVDSQFKENMTKEECADFVTRGISYIKHSV